MPISLPKMFFVTALPSSERARRRVSALRGRVVRFGEFLIRPKRVTAIPTPVLMVHASAVLEGIRSGAIQVATATDDFVDEHEWREFVQAYTGAGSVSDPVDEDMAVPSAETSQQEPEQSVVVPAEEPAVAEVEAVLPEAPVVSEELPPAEVPALEDSPASAEAVVAESSEAEVDEAVEAEKAPAEEEKAPDDAEEVAPDDAEEVAPAVEAEAPKAPKAPKSSKKKGRS